MATLDELESQATAAIQDGRLILSTALLASLGTPQPPPWLGELAALALDAPVISRPSGALLITGGLTDPRLGAVVLSCEVMLRDGTPSTRIRWAFTQPPRLDEWFRDMGLSAAAGAAQFLGALAAQAVRLQETLDGAVVVSLEVSGALASRMGGLTLSLSLTSVSFAAGGLRPTQIRGLASVGDLTLPLTVSLDDPIRVTASAPDLTIADLIGKLGLRLPPLPPLPLLSTPLDDLRLTLDPEVRLSGRIPVGGLGALTLVVASRGDSLIAVAGLEVPPGFRFSNLTAALAPLDILSGAVSFGAPALVLATASSAAFPYPTPDGGWRDIAVEAGALFAGSLKLQGLGLDVLGALTGLDRLPFTLPLSPSMQDVRLVAHLPGAIQALPGVLEVSDLNVTAAVEPFSLGASGQARLGLFGMPLPALRLGVSLGEGQQAIFLRTDEPWSHPLGLPIDIDELGLQVSEPPPAYGVSGKIRLASRTLDVAAQFIGEAPSLLAAELKGDLSLSNLLAELIGVDLLPDYFEPQINDPSVYIVLNPLGVTIAERSYPAGVGLDGRASYLGLAIHLRLNAKPERVVAEGGLSGPIRLSPVLEITGPGGNGAPSFTLDTGGDPILSLGGRVRLMGLEQDVVAIAGAEGLRFNLAQHVGPVAVDLNGLLGEQGFQAGGHCAFQLRGSTGPIRLYDGGPNLGSIHFDTGFDGEAAIGVLKAGGAHVTLHGAFSLIGVRISLPEIEVSPESLAKLPEQVVAYLLEHAQALFADLLKSADLWLKAIAEAVIVEVENVARALKEHFLQATDQIAHGLHDTLHYTGEQTAKALKSIGETAEGAAKALAAVGYPVEEIGKALLKVGYPLELVTGALGALGQPAKEVERILVQAGVVAADAAHAVGSVLQHLPDVVPFIKIPEIFGKAPEVFVKVPVFGKLPDHLKLPHVDHLKIF